MVQSTLACVDEHSSDFRAELYTINDYQRLMVIKKAFWNKSIRMGKPGFIMKNRPWEL
jgi:hypothetical protein